MTSPTDIDSPGQPQALSLKRDPSSLKFLGRRLAEPTGATVSMLIDGQEQPLPLHLDLRNHSPTGFEWGYPGSGPAQLALAMCAELVDDWHAQRVYQLVKIWLISSIPQSNEQWQLTGTQVHGAILEALKVLAK